MTLASDDFAVVRSTDDDDDDDDDGARRRLGMACDDHDHDDHENVACARRAGTAVETIVPLHQPPRDDAYVPTLPAAFDAARGSSSSSSAIVSPVAPMLVYPRTIIVRWTRLREKADAPILGSPYLPRSPKNELWNGRRGFEKEGGLAWRAPAFLHFWRGGTRHIKPHREERDTL